MKKTDPARYLVQDCDFALLINGNRMQNARLCDGDIALVVKQSDADPGDLVAVEYTGGDITTYRLYEVDGTRILVSENELEYPPIILDRNAPCKIIGRIIGVHFSK